MTDGQPSNGRPRRRTRSSRQRGTEDRQPGRTGSGSDLAEWGEQIYAAPAGRSAHGDVDARVTVSTRLRKPRVHLTAPTVVPQMDLARYMGRWYEIARLPYFTQRRCIGTVTADYHLGDDGLVHVTNQCAHADNGVGKARGIARVIDPSANTKLEISFRTLYGVHVLWDEYWVIGLGADYDYALVGQPSRRRGWVLARDPQPSEDAILSWLEEFESKGFPAQAFERTQQRGLVTASGP